MKIGFIELFKRDWDLQKFKRILQTSPCYRWVVCRWVVSYKAPIPHPQRIGAWEGKGSYPFLNIPVTGVSITLVSSVRAEIFGKYPLSPQQEMDTIPDQVDQGTADPRTEWRSGLGTQRPRTWGTKGFEGLAWPDTPSCGTTVSRTTVSKKLEKPVME